MKMRLITNRMAAGLYSLFLHFTSEPRDFILTGIPRSGTSLLSALLTECSNNCVCFNEIHYDVTSLPLFFRKMRKKIKAGEPIPNKVSDNGELITSTNNTNKNSIGDYLPRINSNEIVLGSKVTIPYLNQINRILAQNDRVVAMVRDPVYTLGSWNLEKLSNTPMGRVTRNNLHSHWENINFFSSNEHERRANIWEHYAALIWSLREKVKIVKYENLINQTSLLKELSNFLGIHLMHTPKELESYNIDSRYKELEKIRRAVEKYCPSRKHFGYH